VLPPPRDSLSKAAAAAAAAVLAGERAAHQAAGADNSLVRQVISMHGSLHQRGIDRFKVGCTYEILKVHALAGTHARYTFLYLRTSLWMESSCIHAFVPSHECTRDTNLNAGRHASVNACIHSCMHTYMS
jgi:hypothetical protein